MDPVLHDREYSRHGGGACSTWCIPTAGRGYRSRFRDSGTTLRAEVYAATDKAHAALWRVLLARIVTTVSARIALDDPLPLLLTDSRLVTTSSTADGLWVRVLDVAAVLAARRYAVEIDTGAGGPRRVPGPRRPLPTRRRPDGATCEPVTTGADVELDIADLGSLVTGHRRVLTLARAGRLAGDPKAVDRLDAAFIPEREPFHATDF